jgi:hypothetical protein
VTGPAPVVELRLLTHRPEAMVAWWAALLGGSPRTLDRRTTAIPGPHLHAVIEGSQIALDYHPEASGVTAVNLRPGDREAVRRAVNRLGQLGSHPFRATGSAGEVALWYRDPNGTQVALNWATAEDGARAAGEGLPEELDVRRVLRDIDDQHGRPAAPGTTTQRGG